MYQVIEFVELPYSSLAHTYVCVPVDWVKWRDESKEKVIVAYPVEEPSYTRKRVISNEQHSRDWKCYLAKAELASGSYDEAVNVTQYLNNKRKNEENVKLSTNLKKRKLEASSSKNKPSKQHCEKPKLILPPEYDPGFPRWSLKYPNSNYKDRTDLKELQVGREKTGIFVNRLGYDKCFEESDNDHSLARNLMMEIFTESALQVCTLTGKAVSRAGGVSEKRPALHVHGVNALVDIVLRHGFEDGDETSIRNCLSAKLYTLRRKNE